jgi:hypothetical protein
MHSLFLLLLSCKGCGAWWVMPQLPQVQPEEPSPFDTAVDDPDPEDSGDIPLPPPSACANVEAEPNGVNEPQDLPLEAWMCGIFGEPIDNDYFAFSIEEASWLRVWVRAAELGSFANPRAFLLDEDDGDFSASFEDSYLSPDIDRTFKLDRARDLKIGLLEQEIGTTQFGPDFEWRMRVSVVKAPVTWNTEEAVDDEGDDFNNSSASPDMVFDGDRVFGRMEKVTNDWYAIDLTDERTEVVIQTDAWIHGSPLNPELLVRDPDGDTIAYAYTHDNAQNFDALVSFTAQQAGEYLIKLSPVDGFGGQPYWYVLDVSAVVVPSAVDTGIDD